MIRSRTTLEDRMVQKKEYINREISWLSFNERVLQEAADPNVPLLARLRFLGIFSNNLDEFFRVRVATLTRMTVLGKKARAIVGDKPEVILDRIQDIAIRLQHNFEEIYQHILYELEKEHIFLINEKQVDDEQARFVRTYFRQEVRSNLVPIMLDEVGEFPYLKDKSIYLAIKLSHAASGRSPRYSLIEVPTDVVPRFLVLPERDSKQYVIILDDVIRFCLGEVFSIFKFDRVDAYTIKLTRDAELDIEEDFSKSYIEKISKSLKQRQKGQPVRFVYDGKIPKDLLRFLMKRMGLSKNDTMIAGGRYHNFKDFMNFPSLGAKTLDYDSIPPVPVPCLNPLESIMDVLWEQDVMLYYPYHSFSTMTDLLREAAIDEQVTTIKITLYRVAEKSRIINALINAAKNGKDVTVVVELQARFDEEANIYWATLLQEEGVKVIFGIAGLKIHCKLCLITRKEGRKQLHVANISTGNYHEKTARLYTDRALFTSDKRITTEVNKIFNFFENTFKVSSYRHLLVAPLNMRQRFISLINREIKNAKAGKKARIFIKLNSLTDHEMIDRLYKAGKAGVKVRMILRGICSLVPGISGVSENIKVISIVDKYLEHDRIFIFHNDGNESIYISSADWMPRNLDHRVEVACPIYDEDIRQDIMQTMKILWYDNTKARVLNNEQDNQYRVDAEEEKIRAQEALYKYYQEKVNTR